jgi:hypothetical protein
MSEECIGAMVRIKSLLSSIPDSVCDEECKKIKEGVSEYLLRNCQHKIVRDYVDVDPDRSWVVFYCIHWETEFDSETPKIEIR